MASYEKETEGTLIDIEGPSDRPFLNQALENAYFKGILSDMVLSTKGEKIKAHKLIILAHCQHLREEIMGRNDEPSLK